MKQIFIFHGGSSFDSYDRYLDSLINSDINYDHLLPARSWQDWLRDTLPNDYQLLFPSFPNKQNSVYDEWTIYFEKLVPFFDKQTQFIGYSLGGMFLAKYLSISPLPIPIKNIIMLAPGYDDETNEDLGSFKVTSAKGIEQSTEHIHLMHSKDDPIVPFRELAKFQHDLPMASSHIFSDKSHFFVETFPELLDVLEQY